jgi:asparagine synthase (glutamine-hydrolysing)
MCGISGAFTTQVHSDNARANATGHARTLVGRIVASQRTRGPDAESIADYAGRDFQLVLGHNRLSIIDLSAAANQPMAATDGLLHVAYNGEIYNYLELRRELEATGVRFRTASDTEVLLEAYRAWGDGAFDRFIGMFALALYDSAAQQLILVRDRFGVKPLFYAVKNGTLAFASTPTELAHWVGAAPDLGYVARGIRQRYYEDASDTSPYIGVPALEASHLLRVSVTDGRLSLVKRRYYDLLARANALAPQLAGADDESLAEQLGTLLRDACALRRRSDVPLGLSVSGGIDSSAIAALMAEAGQPLIGYSFADPDDRASEGPLVAELARATHLTPRYVDVKDGDDIRALFWATLAAQDAPFPSASIMAQYAVFRAARADGTIVLLGGQGGDEDFMGYRKYFLFRAQSVLRGFRVGDAAHLASTVAPLAPAILRQAGLYFGERGRYSGAPEGKGSNLRLPAAAPGRTMGLEAGESLRHRQAEDILRFSIPTLLRYEDRNSMGNSIESRLPFLDQRVVEFGVALPDRAKLGNGFGKRILRHFLRGKVPDRIRLNRDKRGFDVNQTRWIRSGLGDELRSAVKARQSRVAEFLAADADVSALFSDERLASDGRSFQEAVSLIWLGDRL